MNLQLKDHLNNKVKGTKVLFLLILTNLIYGYMLLVSIPKVMNYTNGMKIPDMMPVGYEPEYIYKLLEKLGVEGRNSYLFQQIPVDLFYPFFFCITYFLCIYYLLQKLQKLNRETFYLCLLPVAAGIFDYLENFVIVHMLLSFPLVSASVIKISAFFTVFKSMLSSISFTVMIVLLTMIGYRYFFREKEMEALDL